MMIIDPHPPEAPRRRWPFLAGWSFAAITIILGVLLTHTPASQQASVPVRASPSPSGSVSVSRRVVAPRAPLQASAPSARVEATPAPSPVAVHVVGTVVDDAGTGIPGVEIALEGLASTSTDDRGSFALTYETTAAVVPLNLVTFTKEGFEPDAVRTSRRVIDVRLRHVVSIPQNAAIRLTLDRLDTLCGGTDLNMEMAWRCRRVRLTSTAPGTLRVDAEADSASMGLQLSGGFGNSRFTTLCCWSPLQVHVARNTDVEIDVLWVDDFFGPPGPIDVALETSFVPDGH